jgi:predicted alpha/beta superfamily hydrolase
MKQFLFLVFFVPAIAFGQHEVEIKIKSLPSYHSSSDPIYIAGSFNGWNPADERYKLKNDNGAYKIELNLPQGGYEFKFTRGNWEKGETTADGKSAGNRELIVTGDRKLEISIAGWQDHFPAVPKLSTASKTVRILDTAFYIPQLNRYRRIWVYLPKNYSPHKRYPVLYMHDGQNVFNDSTSFSGEWGVDEFFDTTALAQAIVVAIDNGGQYRLNEYSPYDMDRYGKGQGMQYVEFIVWNLKPYIDRKYRTYKNRQNTFIAGSSMGGLISMYAILRYPNVFGGAGVFSPAFWVAPRINNLVETHGKKLRGKVFFYAGKQESDSMVSDMLKVFERLSVLSKAKMTTVIRDDGKHHESAWRREFPGFYRWMLLN